MMPKVKRIASALGAEISGIDLCQDLQAEEIELIRQWLREHQVIFFRNQPITPAQQARLANHFGDLHIHPIYPSSPENPEVMVLDTELNDLRDNALWHTDVTFIQTPPMASLLSARQVPEFGGDTLWASCSAAWNALSAPLQALLEPLHAEHDITLSFPVSRFASTPEASARFDKARQNNPPVIHPVVRVHPETGEKGLFVSAGFTRKIVELNDNESRAVLDLLFAQSTQPEFCVRWHWQQYDLVMWDNRITQHYACDDYRPQRRVMHRATILGDQPKGIHG